MSSTARPDTFRFVPTDVTGKTHVTFLFFLLSGKSHFFCVDDDHKIARIDMRRENGFLFATQEISGFDRYPAEHLVGCIDSHHLRGISLALAENVVIGKRVRKLRAA